MQVIGILLLSALRGLLTTTILAAATLAVSSAQAQQAALPDLQTRAYSDEKYSAGDNPYKVERFAPQYFVDHQKQFEEAFFEHPEGGVWTIIAPNSISTIHVIDAPEGLIYVDAGFTREQMESVVAKVAELTDKPVKAVIYTHAHVDHTGGILGVVSREQVQNGEVEIIAHESFMDAYTSENAATGPLMGQRSMMMYGAFLQPADQAQYTTGCCGQMHAAIGSSDFVPPTKTVGDEDTLTVAGLELNFLHTGGENSAHIVAYSPTHKSIFIGDEMQGPTLPQLHSPRGTKFRDTDAWVAAIDKIRSFDAEHMMPGHGKPAFGKEAVSEIIIKYRDAMQYLHDQAIRLINQGKSPDDLANEIALPDYLIVDPFTVSLYGNPKTILRSFFTGYVSWYDGNPANLDPLPKAEEDQRLVDALGGRDAVFAMAEKAFKDGEAKWSLALSDKLVRINHEDMGARHLKAAALRTLGYAAVNSSNRGFYLSGADELDGLLDMNHIAAGGRNMVMSEGVIAGLPTVELMDNLRYRVLPEKVGNTDTGYLFRFTDQDQAFTVRLRNGIAEVSEGEHDHDVVFTTDRARFDKLFLSDDISIRDVVDIEGAEEDIARFDAVIDMTFYSIQQALQ